MNLSSFWQGRFGKLLRWMVFLPIAFIIIFILQDLPVRVFAWASETRPVLSFLTIIIGLIVVSILGTFAWLWFLGMSLTPLLACGVVAPNSKIGAVIFGTLYCLAHGIYLLSVLQSNAHWIFSAYYLVCGVIIVYGTVMTYKADSET